MEADGGEEWGGVGSLRSVFSPWRLAPSRSSKGIECHKKWEVGNCKRVVKKRFFL
jgi:hypothetical protein